jgi:hypothetical protein
MEKIKNFKIKYQNLFLIVLLLALISGGVFTLVKNEGLRYSEFKEYYKVTVTAENGEDLKKGMDAISSIKNVARIDRKNDFVIFQNRNNNDLSKDLEGKKNDSFEYSVTKIIPSTGLESALILNAKVILATFIVGLAFISYAVVTTKERLRVKFSSYFFVLPTIVFGLALGFQIVMILILSNVFMIRDVDLISLLFVLFSTLFLIILSINDIIPLKVKSLEELTSLFFEKIKPGLFTTFKLLLVILPIVSIGLGVRFLITAILITLSLVNIYLAFALVTSINFTNLLGFVKGVSTKIKKVKIKKKGKNKVKAKTTAKGKKKK